MNQSKFNNFLQLIISLKWYVEPLLKQYSSILNFWFTYYRKVVLLFCVFINQ